MTSTKWRLNYGRSGLMIRPAVNLPARRGDRSGRQGLLKRPSPRTGSGRIGGGRAIYTKKEKKMYKQPSQMTIVEPRAVLRLVLVGVHVFLVTRVAYL